MKKLNTKLILVAGGTASGKTTIAIQMAKKIEVSLELKPTLISLDNYYFEKYHWENIDEEMINWDEPSAFNWNLLRNDLKKLLNGEIVKKPIFDYETNSYSKTKTEEYKPSNLIIIEGIFSLYDAEIRKMASSLIFVDVDADIRLIRRLKRDVERHSSTFNRENFLKSWVNVLKPMHDTWIQPQKNLAQIVIQNNSHIEDPDGTEFLDLLIDLKN